MNTNKLKNVVGGVTAVLLTPLVLTTGAIATVAAVGLAKCYGTEAGEAVIDLWSEAGKLGCEAVDEIIDNSI